MGEAGGGEGDGVEGSEQTQRAAVRCNALHPGIALCTPPAPQPAPPAGACASSAAARPLARRAPAPSCSPGPRLARQWAASASRHTAPPPGDHRLTAGRSPRSAGANGRPGKVLVTNENRINKSYYCTQESGRNIFMAS
ncbi:PREDICTED: translation initiation factor IF-2-like [Chinchilla lanigera]|uniref:translation initiation factor IF-2-like n=1 Tax=Chinchilla lanigera TaxID=34839 RepID=UPI000697F6C9|nr:PREDICTED: translation initiation factor IF-2-like [Chinchilla lanigera]